MTASFMKRELIVLLLLGGIAQEQPTWEPMAV